MQLRMRKITYTQAIANKEDVHLFVMNIKKPDGNINMNVMGDDGTLQAIVIPKTFIPVDMSLFINRNNLLNNQTFRRLLSRGDSVVLVDTQDALAAIESTPMAQAEMKRILSAGAVINDESQDTSEFITMNATGTPSHKEVLPDVSPFCHGVIQRANEGGDVADIMLDIQGKLGSLDLNDLEYICANVEDASLKQWIVDTIVSRKTA